MKAPDDFLDPTKALVRHYPKQANGADVAPPSDGAVLLDEIHTFLGRFVSYPSDGAHVAHTLWIVHTHCMEAWESTPRLAFLSPEPASGKTRAIEITETLVPNPVEAVNVTPAYLFRKVGDKAGPPTILFDEIDTVFGPKAQANEEIRALLNAGHRRGAVAGRCVVKGRTVVTEEIPAFCAVAVAGLGDLPDTILTRAVVIPMRRRTANEKIEGFRRRKHAPQGAKLRKRIAAWAAAVVETLTETEPEMPQGVSDRDADVWEPLLAIAEVAGGSWPEMARKACVTGVTGMREGLVTSLGVRLLADMRTVFGETDDKMTTAAILKELIALPESPWADIKGKPLNDLGLARRLRHYAIKPKLIREGDLVSRGYERGDFIDAWGRYLDVTTVTTVTGVTGSERHEGR